MHYILPSYHSFIFISCHLVILPRFVHSLLKKCLYSSILQLFRYYAVIFFCYLAIFPILLFSQKISYIYSVFKKMPLLKKILHSTKFFKKFSCFWKLRSTSYHLPMFSKISCFWKVPFTIWTPSMTLWEGENQFNKSQMTCEEKSWYSKWWPFSQM